MIRKKGSKVRREVGQAEIGEFENVDQTSAEFGCDTLQRRDNIVGEAIDVDFERTTDSNANNGRRRRGVALFGSKAGQIEDSNAFAIPSGSW